MEAIESLQQRLEKLEAENRLLRTDAATRGFWSLNNIINQQIDHLNGFTLSREIDKDPKESPRFARSKDMWENLPKLITALNTLRVEMKIDGDKEDKKENIIPLTPQLMAKQNITGY